MNLVNAKCTNCGAVLEIDKEKECLICKFCGNPFIVEKAINNYNTIVNNNISINAENLILDKYNESKELSLARQFAFNVRVGNNLYGDSKKAQKKYELVYSHNPLNIEAKVFSDIFKNDSFSNIYAIKELLDELDFNSIENKQLLSYFINLLTRKVKGYCYINDTNYLSCNNLLSAICISKSSRDIVNRIKEIADIDELTNICDSIKSYLEITKKNAITIHQRRKEFHTKYDNLSKLLKLFDENEIDYKISIDEFNEYDIKFRKLKDLSEQLKKVEETEHAFGNKMYIFALVIIALFFIVGVIISSILSKGPLPLIIFIFVGVIISIAFCYIIIRILGSKKEKIKEKIKSVNLEK